MLEWRRNSADLSQCFAKLGKPTQNATTFDMITDIKSSIQYTWQQESKDMLAYIHGGEDGAIFGAWDLIAA